MMDCLEAMAAAQLPADDDRDDAAAAAGHPPGSIRRPPPRLHLLLRGCIASPTCE